MKLELTAHSIELTPDFRESVGRRIHFALGRFADRIKSVSVRVADVNGPRGGIDKCCIVRIYAGLRRTVVIREQRSDVHAAVAVAAERAGRSMTRQLQLHRQAAVVTDQKLLERQRLRKGTWYELPC